MGKEITIKEQDQWNFNFYCDDNVIWNRPSQNCDYCCCALQKGYSFIIECLKEAGLLPDDYIPICCYCYVLQRTGLLHLRKDLVGFLYKTELDILRISFDFDSNENRWGPDVRIYFYIHDYSKVE